MARTSRAFSGSPERLTVQEAKFVVEYIKDGVGSRAVLDCGMCPSGAKQQAANTATALLKKPRILAAIREQLEASSARTLITVDRLLQEVYRGAVYNVADAFGPDGQCLEMNKMPEDLQRAIEGFEVIEVKGQPGTYIKSFKFSKKSVHQQILLERLENIVKRFEITGKDGKALHSPGSGVDLSDVSVELLKRIVGMHETAKAEEKK